MNFKTEYKNMIIVSNKHDIFKEDQLKMNRKMRLCILWAVFSCNGFSDIVFIDYVMNSEKYLDILNDYFLPIGKNIEDDN